jgi:hypothetical protein
MRLSTKFHGIPFGKLVENFPFHQIPRDFHGKKNSRFADTWL